MTLRTLIAAERRRERRGLRQAGLCAALVAIASVLLLVALIGANGAGKSTTLRAIAGQLRPRAGAITFRGQDVTALPSHERAMLGIALVRRSSADRLSPARGAPPKMPRMRSRIGSGPTDTRACSESWNGMRNAFAAPRVWPKRSFT